MMKCSALIRTFIPPFSGTENNVEEGEGRTSTSFREVFLGSGGMIYRLTPVSPKWNIDVILLPKVQGMRKGRGEGYKNW